MSKEAMKLALDALKQIDDAMPFPVAKLAQAALREALAKPDFWEGYVPEPVKPAQQELTNIERHERNVQKFLAEQPAQQEVDWEKLYRLEVKKKDALAAKYERDTGKKLTRIIPMAEQPAQQEPVAWKLVPIEPTEEMLKAMDECSKEGYDERLYAGHAASVYMAAVDAAPTPPAQRTWVGLVDKEIENLWHEFHDREFGWARRFTRAIEAKLKEKNDEQETALRF